MKSLKSKMSGREASKAACKVWVYVRCFIPSNESKSAITAYKDKRNAGRKTS